jgi:hypothetical protein
VPRCPGRRGVQVVAGQPVVRGLSGLPLRLGGFPLFAQRPQRGGDPLVPRPRRPGILGDLVAAVPRPVLLVFGGVGAGVRGNGLLRDLPQPIFGPVRRLRRARRDLRAVQRDHAQLPHAQPRAQAQHLGEKRGDRVREAGPEPGDRGVVRQVPAADHPERHIGMAQLLDPPRGRDLMRVRPDQHRHQHVRVITRRAGPAERAHVMKRPGVHPLHRPDHQPHRMPGRQPVPHARREQKHLVTLDPTVPLRHYTIIPGNHELGRKARRIVHFATARI